MHDLKQLAEAAGAIPAEFAPFDPSASIPLFVNTSGGRGYESTLTNAVLALYDRLRWDDALRAATERTVVVNEKTIGKVPNLRRPISEPRRQAMTALLHSLAHIASAPVISKERGLQRQTCVAVPLDTQAFRKGAAYESLSATAIRDIIVALARYDWIDVVPAYYNVNTGKRLRTRVRPKRSMLDWLVQQKLVFPYHPRGQQTPKRGPENSLLFVSVDNGEGNRGLEPLDRSLSPEEAVLRPLNKALSEQRLKCSFRDYQQYVDLYDFKRGRPRYRLTGNKTLRRVFTEEDGRGGRLYGHWVQRLPKELRRRLTVGSKPMAELDYNGMQLALLYADVGKQLPDQADLYSIPGFKRDDMKAVFLRTVGTATREQTVAALRKMLHEQGRSRQGRAEALYDAFWGFHAEVCPHCRAESEAAWVRLQELDSLLALRVLRKLLDKGITAIPIHDSFLVEEPHVDTTETIMVKEFDELFGVAGASVNRAW